MSLSWLPSTIPFLCFALGFLVMILLARSLMRNPNVSRKWFAFLISITWGSLIFTAVVIGSNSKIEVVANGVLIAISNWLGFYPLMYYLYPSLKQTLK